jgi:hypothetical protein
VDFPFSGFPPKGKPERKNNPLPKVERKSTATRNNQMRTENNQATNRQPQSATSIVSERLTWLIGHKVRVKLRTTPDGQSEDFTGIYEDCLPVGRGYFMVFKVEEKRRMLQSDHIIQLDEL